MFGSYEYEQIVYINWLNTLVLVLRCWYFLFFQTLENLPKHTHADRILLCISTVWLLLLSFVIWTKYGPNFYFLFDDGGAYFFVVTFVLIKFMLRFTFNVSILSSCVIYYSSSFLSPYKTRSSACLKWFNYSPLIFHSPLIHIT